MTIQPTFDNLGDWLAAKPGGHFTVERWGRGWAVTVHRIGCPVETVLAKSAGEVNRLRLSFSDEGLTGFIGKGA